MMSKICSGDDTSARQRRSIRAKHRLGGPIAMLLQRQIAAHHQHWLAGRHVRRILAQQIAESEPLRATYISLACAQLSQHAGVIQLIEP